MRVPGIWLSVIVCLAGLSVAACGARDSAAVSDAEEPRTYVTVLGVAQDGGSPHIGCGKDCCRNLWKEPESWRRVVCLGLVDDLSGERWLVEATPDLPHQLRALLDLPGGGRTPLFKGVFLTHAHIGHYPGLMYFGREARGADGVPVYAMPRMAAFLRENGPWDQLVRLGNIEIAQLADGVAFELNARIEVTPITVPHRDEYSETVGYRISGPNRSLLFIPDVDKWEKTSSPIEEWIAGVDVAYLDGSFFSGGELPNRDMSEIPHPFIVESLDRFGSLPVAERAKIRFIHLNHSNPALDPESDARAMIRASGMAVAEEGEKTAL